jgi:hypothetical protein
MNARSLPLTMSLAKRWIPLPSKVELPIEWNLDTWRDVTRGNYQVCISRLICAGTVEIIFLSTPIYRVVTLALLAYVAYVNARGERGRFSHEPAGVTSYTGEATTSARMTRARGVRHRPNGTSFTTP